MKINLRIILILSFAVFVSAFKEKKVSFYDLKRVYIKVDKDDTIMKLVNLDEFQNEFSKSFLTKSKREAGNLDIEFNLSSPQLFRFSCLEPQTTTIIVLISPGDSISYSLDERKEIIFKGRNSSHYNFFKKLNDANIRYRTYNKTESVWKYKENTELNYKKRLVFLEDYIKNEKVSDLFSKKMRDVLKFEYINWLLNRFIIPENAIDDYAKYLKGIDNETFTRIDQKDNGYFHLALTNYLFLISKINSKDGAYSSEALNYQLEFIKKNLSDTVKEYAITKTLVEFDNHLKSEYLNLLKNKITENLSLIKEEKYKVILEKINERLLTQNAQLSDDVLNSILSDVDGKSISLNEILKKEGGKIKVIDFWASWCSPCIDEIKKSHAFRNKLIQENNIVFLYFSIDKNYEDWKDKVEKLNKYGMSKNQYLILGNTSSNIGSYLKITSIPQYVILNSNNEMVSLNSTSPSENLEFEKLIKNISE